MPPLTGPVVDLAQALPDAQRQALTQRLTRFEAEHGTQIVVLLVPSTAPEDIAAYANRVANAWAIGRRDVGDGVLVVVALQQRRLRIEVAKALEGAIPDLAAKRIIDQAIVPHFKAGDVPGGLQAGLEQIMARISQEGLPAPEGLVPGAGPEADRGAVDNAVLVLIAAAFFGTLLGSRLGRVGGLGLGGLAGAVAGWVLAQALWALALGAVVGALTGARGGGGGHGLTLGSGRHRGGWTAGGSGAAGGSGWGSGGGGDFGGGGASGDW